MCGIVGYIGGQNATPIILNGLRRLEYRGYDSAGLAVLQNEKIEIRRDAGKLDNLVGLVANRPVEGTIGIGHTRWATHGEPNARNAHPHVGATGEVVVVHNGIVENFLELREELALEGVKFNSDTDTEIIAHLIEHFMAAGNGLENAMRESLKQLKGAHGVVAFCSREPDKIVAARIGNAGGVVVGKGENENFVASDIPAILEHTRKVIFLDSRQMAV
ncbi:glutamine--fructose-6-phosphate aminotransferase, partial [bacterium]